MEKVKRVKVKKSKKTKTTTKKNLVTILLEFMFYNIAFRCSKCTCE